MIFEHFALNVEDLPGVRDWYCENMGLHVAWSMDKAPFMTFLADTSGRVVCELYHRTDAPITDYKNQNHLSFHFAFVSENAEADKDRLINNGATLVEEVRPGEGTHLVMLRDPWGLPLQLCERKTRLTAKL